MLKKIFNYYFFVIVALLVIAYIGRHNPGISGFAGFVAGLNTTVYLLLLFKETK